MNNYIIHRDDELYHYGVDGQKWGIRRYQNEDGSYKPGAEGRYDPDGRSNTRKKTRKETASVREDWLEKRRRNNKSGKTDSELEDDEISERADRIQKQNKGISREEAEGMAEDEMMREDRERRKAAGKETLLDRWTDKIEKAADEKAAKKAAKEKEKAEKKAREEKEAEEWMNEMKKNYEATQRAKAEKKAAKEQAKAAKKEEKMSKNSYKKIAGKYLLKNIGLTAAGNILGNVVANKTGNTALGLYTNAAIQGTGKTINMIKSGKEAYDLHQYRKKKSARHSAFDEYDELYHGEFGGFYGIKRA